MTDYSAAVEWLLKSKDPSTRYILLRDILGVRPDSSELVDLKSLIPTGPRVKLLLGGEFGLSDHYDPDSRPYRKWSGTHWRLLSLVNLKIPPDNDRTRKAAFQTLEWLYGTGKRRAFRTLNGLTRIHASVYGNGLGVWSYLGFHDDERVHYIADMLMETQWPDGGWNCDNSEKAKHSSFHESLLTLWGLAKYQKATGSKEIAESVERVCELFLSHRIFRSHTSGEIIKKEWLKLRYPVYWHYNFLEAMAVLSITGKAKDDRMSESLDLLESKCIDQKWWEVEGCYWQPPEKRSSNRKQSVAGLELIDWGRAGPNEMITLNALRVLKLAGRLTINNIKE